MARTALISVFCPDRTGLVADLTAALFDLGADLGDTSFAVLGTGAEFTALCELPPDVELTAVDSSLRGIPGVAKGDLSVRPFGLDATQGPAGRITHTVTVHGGDRPGLIARLCEVFVEFRANIVRMNSERIPDPVGPRYAVTFAVSIPRGAEAACIATVANTAGEMGLGCHWEGTATPAGHAVSR